jgi:hypothetical protein
MAIRLIHYVRMIDLTPKDRTDDLIKAYVPSMLTLSTLSA